MSNYTDRREQILAELAPDEQAVFDEAYAAAGLAMELAETAYRARQAAGLTQTELARRMGTTQSAIAAIESGARIPTVELLDVSPAPAANDSPSASTPPNRGFRRTQPCHDRPGL